MKQLQIIEQDSGDNFTLYDSSNDTFLRLFAGFEYADVITSIDDVAGNYGSVYITSKHGRRRLSVTGEMLSTTVFTKRRELLKALRQTGIIKLLKFITYDDIEMQCEAEVVKLTFPYTHQIHSFLIEFVAPDWRFYSQSVTSQIMPISLVSGGADIPFPYIPVDISGSLSGAIDEESNIINLGNEVTDPVLKIYGPGTHFIMTNLTTNQTMVLDSTLVEGDVVEIDVKNRSVALNGTDNLYPDLTGDFWSLIPGENQIRFFVTSGSVAGDTLFEVVYRHAYSGI